MRHARFVLSLFLIILFPLTSFAQEMPIFDAHIHYSQPDWSVYSPEAIMKLFYQAGVPWAMVSSTPDNGTVRLYETAPNRIVPILRPYRTRGDMSSWMNDSTILSYVEERLQKGIYKGIGEFHLSAGQTHTEVVRVFAKLVLRHKTLLHAHTDDTGIEELLRFYPEVRMLWAHGGMSAEPQRIGALLDQYSTLYVELSLRDRSIAPSGQLDAAWRNLFLRHSDRFVVGSDTWITSRWESFVAIHTGIRTWLHQLPRDVSEKLAFKNAFGLVGKP